MRICGYKDLSTEKSFIEENSDFGEALENSERSTAALNTAREEIKCTMREFLFVLSRLPEMCQNLKDKYIYMLNSPPRVEANAFVPEPITVLSEAESGLIEKSYEGELLRMLDSILSTPIFNNGAEGTERELNDSWLGCGSFLCPKYRSIGDHRPRCTAAAEQCTLCEVHVCPDCVAKNSRCDCAYCKDHYSCPNCIKKLGSLCKKVEEEEEVIRKLRIQEEQQTIWKRQLEEANDMAELVRDFFTRDSLQSMPVVSESEKVTIHEEDTVRQSTGEAGH